MNLKFSRLFYVVLSVIAAICASFCVHGQTQSAPGPSEPTSDAEEIDFGAEVRPILSDRCFFCHGPEEEDRQAELRMDLPADLQDREPVIVAGDREASLVWQRINDPEDPMPPVESHKSLTKEEIEILGRWIDQGGRYETHWSYAPVTKPAVPNVEDNGWSRGEIDRFIFHELARRQLQPSPTARPARLLRRLYLDLTGLPPTAEEVAAFESNPSEDAYAKVVERLLRSPRFGEHWAVWWLDLVRYSDSVGFHGDQPRSVWPYRDWVVQALNSDMPFDKFTRYQLAGDLMGSDDESPEAKTERLIASSYNRLGPVTSEGGAQPAEYLAIYAADRVANFGEVWLASSTGCARCHDHKYDPFSTADFYSLAAVFADIEHPIIGNESKDPHWGPFCFLPQDEEQAALVAALEGPYDELHAEHPTAGMYESWKVSRHAGEAPPHGPWSKTLDELIKKRIELAKTVPVGLITRTRPEPRTVRMLPRGNWLDESGEIVEPRAPEFLGGTPGATERFSRLDLANWLFEEDNPLTARVLVNRVWSRFFGRGISGNTLDVGNQGEPPSHRELVDWLAVEFRDGWDMRHVIRLIVTSAAYRQSSNQPPHLVQADPENRWLARQAAPRLPAEVLRDQALVVSGLLVNQLGGPSVFPYQPERHWDSLNFPKRKYKPSKGDDLYRRSLYTWSQRTFPHPAMTIFDAPNRESCTAQRPESNTPLQALTLLNEPLYVESARNLAEHTILTHSDHNDRLASMFMTVLLRGPSETEQQRLQSLFDWQKTYFATRPADAEALCSVGESTTDESIPREELAVYTSIARVILNLHEALTKP